MIDYDGLNRLAYQIKTETKKAANTALRVGTLFEDIIAALREGDNGDLINSINKINTDISKIINQIKDINNNIDQTIIKRIETAERNINNIISNVNTINSTLANHTTTIENINGQISTINNNLTTISNQISNINSTISGISSDLTALTSRVTVNEADIADLRRQIINLNIDAIREAISNLQTDLGDLERRVTTLEGDVIDLRADLNAEIERAEATYAKKSDLPDMTDVFYKSKGGTVKAETTFQEPTNFHSSLTIEPGILIFNHDPNASNVDILRVGQYPFMAVHPSTKRFEFGERSHTFQLESNSSLLRGSHSGLHKIWDEENDGSGSGLDADLLDGHHYTDFALKSDIPSLPDMANVFYKNVGGTVTAETTFTQKVTHSSNIQLTSSYLDFNTSSSVSESTLMHLHWGSMNSRLLGFRQVNRVTGSISSTFPCTFIGNETMRVALCTQGFVEADDSSLKEILHEGNSVYVVSSYPTNLASYPDGAIFIKTS